MEGSIFTLIISRWTVNAYRSIWCKDWQVQGNVPEIYMQSLYKLRYMPLETEVGLYISPQICIVILHPKHILVHLSNHPWFFWGTLWGYHMHAQAGSHVGLLIDWTITCQLSGKSIIFKEDFFLNIIFLIRKNVLVENNCVNFSYSQNFTL